VPPLAGLPFLVGIKGFGFRAPKSRVRGFDVTGRVEAVFTSYQVVERLGHSSVTTTTETYSRGLPAMQRDAIERMEEAV
jgi:integrase